MPARFNLRERLHIGRSNYKKAGTYQDTRPSSHASSGEGQPKDSAVSHRRHESSEGTETLLKSITHPGKQPEDLSFISASSYEDIEGTETAIQSVSHRSATGSERANFGEPSTAIHNDLWYRAYNNLKEDLQRSRYITEYEKLLVTVFLGDDLVQNSTRDSGNDPTPSEISLEESRLRLIIERGLEKIEKSKKLIQRSNKVKEAITPIREILNIPLKNLNQTALPWAVVTSSLDLLIKPTKSMTTLYDGVNQVSSRIHWYSKITDSLLSPGNNTATLEQVRELLDTKILGLYQSLLFYQIKSVCFYYRNQFLVILRAFADLDDWDGDLSDVVNSERELRDDLEPYKQEQILSEIKKLSVTLQEQAEIGKERKCMQHLRGIDPRDQIRDIQERREKPVRELYEWVLDTEEYKSFVDWEDPKSSNLLWINGQAGTGKTMLSVGLIQELLASNSSDGPEILYFLVQSTDKELNKGTAVLRGLMWLLLVHNPGLARYLWPKYQESGNKLFDDSMAFMNLLPIFNDMVHDEDIGNVVLLIDALDECKDAGEDVLRILRRLLPTDGSMSKVKILVTSRPFLEIEEKIKHSKISSTALIRLDERSLLGPINMYLDRKRPDLERKTRDGELVDRTMERLRENTGRTFIWVSLVCNRLISLPEAFWEETLDSIPKRLQDLYEFLLERLKSLDPHRRFDYCKDVLFLVMLACRPLTLCELDVLAKLPKGRVKYVVQDCSSFLTVQRDTVYLIHQSAQDYLRENHRQLKKENLEELYHEGFERSLDGMDQFLERNMYKLPNHGVMIEEVQAPVSNGLDPIRYSCQYWIYHLEQGGLQASDVERIYKFLCRHFLHWLEALSLLEIIPHGVDTINNLLFMLRSDGNHRLSRFLLDGKRFLTKFSPAIARAPLQAYVSALAFAPKTSRVKGIFREEASRWILRVQPLEMSWGALLRTFHVTGAVWKVAVSPDGGLMATSSSESLSVWNTATGALVQRLGDNWFHSVDFSPCGQLLAAVPREDGSVRLWDTVKWRERQLLRHQGKEVWSCAFSPCGSVLASVSAEGIYLWDFTMSSIRWSTANVDKYFPFIVFSPDGKLVAAGGPGKAYLYDAESGRLERALDIDNGRGCAVEDVTFSPNGSWMALCSSDGSKVLNTATWSVEWENHEGGEVVEFSTDNLLMVTGMEDGTIEIRSTKT